MKLKLALGTAAIAGAFALASPSAAAPLTGAGLAKPAVQIDTSITEEVRHRRRWRGRHWRGHRIWRPRPRFYRPYHWRSPYRYGAFGPAWAFRRGWGPGFHVGIGW